MKTARFPALSRAAAIAASVVLLAACSREPAPRPDADVVVAVVNGGSLTLKDLKNEILAIRGFSPSLDVRGATREEVSEAMRRLIERTVVLKEGARLGVTLSDAEVEAEVRRLRSDFPPGGLEKALRQEGIAMETWRALLGGTLLYRKSARAIAASRAVVPGHDVEEAFRKTRGRVSPLPERIRVRQMLLDSEEKAGRAREMVLSGKAFEEAARRLSTDDFTPAVVDLGLFSREELPAPLPPELFDLAPGGVSRVVRQDDTYSLFQVAGRESARAVSFEDAAPGIREGLLQARQEEVFRTWLAEEVGKAGVKVRQALLDKFVGEAR